MEVRMDYVEQCLEDFDEARASFISLEDGSQLVFIPEVLIGEVGNGVLIVEMGKGSYMYDGKVPLNEFKLVTNGFQLNVAREAVRIVDGLMANKGSGKTHIEQGTLLPHINKEVS